MKSALIEIAGFLVILAAFGLTGMAIASLAEIPNPDRSVVRFNVLRQVK